jgi:DNA-binding transcriptional ArsR family regulator
MRRDVFQAIADPTRREIISMIARQSLHLNLVAEKFDVSRPAISKHIKILTECGLITIKQYGRHRYCEANLKKLNEVSDWVEQYKKFWTEKLDALETYLDELQQQPPKLKTKTRSAIVSKNKSKPAGTKTKKHVTGKRKR